MNGDRAHGHPVFEALGLPPPVEAAIAAQARKAPDKEVARQPALATLSVIAHSERSFDKDTAKYWSELVEIGLEDTPARETWRELEKMVITYFPGRSTVFEEAYLDGEAKGEARGEARGKAEGVLKVLEVRGVPVSDSLRERITACTDLALLDDLLGRAVTAGCAEELFQEDDEGRCDTAPDLP
ncbi:hypothetical protein ACIBVL_18400 [Streptomyces sp. NPDC049687]|uniref:hypothetical protein n=1 Tax=Streptomyces sp. NPDC049687 TaxID=3365596 RepID=UPI0037966908